jgi:CBS domain-containing protein
MDGGRVLRALLATRLDYVRATQIAANVGQGIALLFGLLGLFGNPMLLFIALFVFIGAGQESASVQMRSTFEGITVSRAMIRDFRSLGPRDPLARAVEFLLSGHQQDFPVVDQGGTPLGILMRSDLLTALAEGRTDRTVEEVMRTRCGVAQPGELLEEVFQRMQQNGCPAVPVVEPGRGLVGMVTLENVGEFAMVEAALVRAKGKALKPA